MAAEKAQFNDLPMVLLEAPKTEASFVRDKQWCPWNGEGMENYIAKNPEAAYVTGALYRMRTSEQGGNREVSVWICNRSEVLTAFAAHGYHKLQVPENLVYYCHGWGLQTYDLSSHTGYTVITNSCHLVLLDPNLFEMISDFPDKPNGDIILHERVSGTALQPELNFGCFWWAGDPEIGNYNIRDKDVIAWFKAPVDFWFAKAWPSQRRESLICGHTAIIEQPRVQRKKDSWGVDRVTLHGSTKMSSKNGPQPWRGKVALEKLISNYSEYPFRVVFRRRDPQGAAKPCRT